MVCRVEHGGSALAEGPRAEAAPTHAEPLCIAYARAMSRSALVLALALPLAACRGSGPGAVEPPGSGEDGIAGATASEGERASAFDLEAFEPPFGRIPLSAAFVRAHGLRRVVVHEDVDTEDARLVDVRVTTHDHDREGRLLRSTTVERGEPGEEARYDYVDGKLVTEVHVLPPDGMQRTTRYAYDAKGRVERIEREDPGSKSEEHVTYDEHGHPSRATRLEGGEQLERRRTYEGDRLVRDVLRLPDGRTRVTERAYDAAGRPTRWVITDRTGWTPTVDAYEFTWDVRGQLRTQSFTEGDAPIYRRSFTYDEDGRPIREEQESFVPAMGHGSVVRYEYERHGELPRQLAAAAHAERTKTELLAATVAAFHGAYEELATVSFESFGEGGFAPASVTVYVPEAIADRWSDEDLKQRACKAKQALRWDCACETVTLGEPQDFAWHSWPDKRVVALTLRFGLGC